MDPIPPAVVAGGLASDFAVGKFLDTLGGKVVGYWSDYRAKQFAAAFISAVAAEDPAGVQERIDAFAKDPRKSAALFDAYRRVALSASPVLGPRIIALIMAKVVSEDREPTENEERVLSAARELLDAELVAARDDWEGMGGLERKTHGRYNEDTSKMEYCEFFELTNGGSTCYEYWLLLGPWAGKLHSMGFMWTVERVTQEDVTEPTLVSDFYWSAAYELLAAMVSKAEAMGSLDQLACPAS